MVGIIECEYIVGITANYFTTARFVIPDETPVFVAVRVIAGHDAVGNVASPFGMLVSAGKINRSILVIDKHTI